MTLRPLHKSVNTENVAEEWVEEPTKVAPRETMLEVVSNDRWRPILDWVELVESEAERRVWGKDLADEVKQESYATLLAGDQSRLTAEAVKAVVRTVANRLKDQDRRRKQRQVNMGVDLEAFEDLGPQTEVYADNARIDRFWRIRRIRRNELLQAGVPPEQASRQAQGHALRECATDTTPDMGGVLDGALRCLTKKEAEVVYRYYWRNQSEVEIGAALDISQPVICKTLKRAIGKIRKVLTARK